MLAHRRENNEKGLPPTTTAIGRICTYRNDDGTNSSPLDAASMRSGELWDYVPVIEPYYIISEWPGGSEWPDESKWLGDSKWLATAFYQNEKLATLVAITIIHILITPCLDSTTYYLTLITESATIITM